MSVYVWILVAATRTQGGYYVTSNLATTPTLTECQRVSVIIQQFSDAYYTKMKCVQVLKP